MNPNFRGEFMRLCVGFGMLVRYLLAMLICSGFVTRAVAQTTEASHRFNQRSGSEVPDFQKHVVPLFGKLGCNAAKCHGSFQGQGGFRLSLFGFDLIPTMKRYELKLLRPKGRDFRSIILLKVLFSSSQPNQSTMTEASCSGRNPGNTIFCLGGSKPAQGRRNPQEPLLGSKSNLPNCYFPQSTSNSLFARLRFGTMALAKMSLAYVGSRPTTKMWRP